MSPSRGRVVVIGAGMVGAACAYYLARAGLDVTVLERGLAGNGTSSRGEGNILVSDKGPGPELELQRHSSRLWREFADERGSDTFELDEKGGLVLGATDTVLDRLHLYADGQVQTGIDARRLTTAELLEREPHLAPDIAGGVFYPEDMQVMPVMALVEHLRAARELGAELRMKVEVTGILRRRDGSVCGLSTSSGDVECTAVVNATGPWAASLCDSFGAPLSVMPRKGIILVTEPLPPLIRHKVYTADYMDNVASSDAALETSVVVEGTRGGTVLIGASRERVGFETTVPVEVVRQLATQAIRVFPFLNKVRLLRVYSGFRPYTPAHLPLIGPDPRIPGLFHACGHEGQGIGLAPGTGHLISELLLGRTPMMDISPFAPAREELSAV